MKRNIIYKGPLIWNTIPREIKNKQKNGMSLLGMSLLHVLD